MTQQIATDRSQSQRLLDCGVDPNSADMYLSVNLNEGENYGKFSTRILGNEILTIDEIMKMRDYVPAWSLSALLDMIKDLGGGISFLPKTQKWMCMVNNLNFPASFDESPIESCLKAIERLKLIANGIDK